MSKDKLEQKEEFDIEQLDGHSSYEDEDDLINSQSDEDDEDEDEIIIKKSKKKSKKNKSNSDEPSFLPFMLKMLIPVLALIVGFIGGWMLMGNDSTQTANQTQSNAVVVSSINNKQTIDESVKSVQNAQLDAIREQYATILNDAELTKKVNTNSYYIAKTNNESVSTIEPLFNTMFDIQTETNNINGFKSKITNIFNIQDDTNIKEFTNNMGNKVLKESPAKILKENGAKSGSTFSTLIGIDPNGNSSYLTITPYATESKILNMMYLVKLNGSSGKIIDFEYVGHMNAKDKSEAKTFYAKLTKMVKEAMVKKEQ